MASTNTEHINVQRRTYLQYLAVAAGMSLITGLAGCGDTVKFNSIDITGGTGYGKVFRLTDHDGKLRTLADYRGKVVTIFFGYLNCPDFCPTHLARQNEVLRLLGKDAARVQSLFVSVDPQRDTPERIKAYVTAFNPSFVGLTGTKEEIDLAVKAFRASYEIVPIKDSLHGYTVQHSTLSMAFDPQGRLRLAIRHEESAQQVAADLALLLAGK